MNAKNVTRIVACSLFFILNGHLLRAQSIFGSITGTVTDASAAVVPNANVTLRNVASGDERVAKTNNDGYYSFSSVPTGKYNILVESPGFEREELTNAEILSASDLNFDFHLKVGTATEAIEVSSAAEQIIPVDSGEKSIVLTQKQLQDFTIVGANAAEFIKILPGFAVRNNSDPTRTGTDYKGDIIGINGNGDGGSQSPLNGAFVANGTGVNNIDITADGAHVSDPGCNCATPVNPNTDMIQEFKVLTSNFSAENSKGPIVINSVSKAGGRDFHGEAYFYARDYVMNSNNWINNYTDTARPDSKYFYPGANIGGPVLIPGTNFNRNRDKLFFFTAFEFYDQTLDTGLLGATVPTAAVRTGDFSPASLAAFGSVTASGAPASALSASALAMYPGGIIPPSLINPSGQGLINLFQQPNANANATGGYNYVTDEVFPQNSWQSLSRVDYNISDNTKLFVRYNLQRETQEFPVSLWWRNADSVPYPTPVLGKNESQSVSASLTHVFNPTLSNEFVFGYSYIDFPNVFQDPSKVSRTALNIPFTGVFNNGVAQVPSMTGWGGSEFATIFNPGGFEAGGSQGLFAKKDLPSASDNLSKVWGTHTAKFGVYYEFVINDQPNNGYTNGLIQEANWAGVTGNPYADLLTGYVGGYQEQNFNNLHNEAYNTIEFFAQDNWKVTRRLTVDYGLRFSHLGPWYDRQGYGFAVWEPSQYVPTSTEASGTGFEWNKKDSSIPLSGFPSRALYYGPRAGLAYDVFGTGKTVIRGGWGKFYYHNAQFTQGLDQPVGVESPSFGAMSFAALENVNVGTQPFNTGAVSATDNTSPNTSSYSFTISQRLPFASLFEASYVGNTNRNQLNTSGVGTNVNVIPYGTLFNVGVDPSKLPSGGEYAYGNYALYQVINVANHNLYSNYNSLQLSWVRQKGNYDITLNYTYSKALGIVGNDQLNLNQDYGPEPFDRRHIFNAAYSLQLGSPIHGNRLAKGVVNGWQISGITQVQSGVNLTATSSGENFDDTASISSGLTVNNAYHSTLSNLAINGTDQIPLQPILTCNPTANLAKNQFVNGNCFTLPTTPGTNGPIVLPEIFGPWFFNSDLSLFKNFQLSESKKLQFRFSAYNFLNHPNASFTGNGVGSNALYLNFNSADQQTNKSFGYVPVYLGSRVIQLAVKYYF